MAGIGGVISTIIDNWLETTANAGAPTRYSLDLAAGLRQALEDGDFTYLYGNGRVAQAGANSTEYFLGDALGSVRQLVDAGGDVTLAKSYTPDGEVLATAGEAANCAFPGGAYLRPGSENVNPPPVMV